MTAASTGLRVVAGPTEATALGNILIQLVAMGDLASVEEGRRLIAQAEPLREYLPEDTALWDEAYVRYAALLAQRAE